VRREVGNQCKSENSSENFFSFCRTEDVFIRDSRRHVRENLELKL